MANIEEFILSELAARGVFYRVRGNDVVIRCPFCPERGHEGRKLKLGIRRTDGILHCWVCGQGGTWNIYAEKVGARKIDYKRVKAEEGVGHLLADLDRVFRLEKLEAEERADTSLWTGDWRGIEAPVLQALDSRTWYDIGSKCDRILWPVRMNGRLHGHMAAHIEPDSPINPKTRSLGGLDVATCLWPYDLEFVRTARSILVVEGQYDAIRCIAFGIPAVCIFGTSNWNREKSNRLVGRYKRVVLGFDGDVAGRACAFDAEDTICDYIPYQTIVWPRAPEGFCDQFGRPQTSYDPGNCSERMLTQIKKAVVGDQ